MAKIKHFKAWFERWHFFVGVYIIGLVAAAVAKDWVFFGFILASPLILMALRTLVKKWRSKKDDTGSSKPDS